MLFLHAHVFIKILSFYANHWVVTSSVPMQWQVQRKEQLQDKRPNQLFP